MLGKLLPERTGEIRHFIPRAAAGGKPAKELLCPIRRLSERAEILRQLFRKHGFYIDFFGQFSHFVSYGNRKSRPYHIPAAI